MNSLDSDTAKPVIGIMGGSFDPVHLGHMGIARQFISRLSLDKLLIMPSHIPPHKPGLHVDAKHRVAMLELAMEELADLGVPCEIDQRELQRQGTSYTVLSLQELRRQYPEASLNFVMGWDSWQNFHLWHQWQNIAEIANLVVFRRPGYCQQDHCPASEKLELVEPEALLDRKAIISVTAEAKTNVTNKISVTDKKLGCYTVIEGEEFDFSSTDVRGQIQQMNTQQRLESKSQEQRNLEPVLGLNAKVNNYIQTHNLYR